MGRTAGILAWDSLAPGVDSHNGGPVAAITSTCDLVMAAALTVLTFLCQPSQWATASRLVEEVWRPSQGASWVSLQVDGHKMQLEEKHGWPEQMPRAGVFKVRGERA